ncbi:MAG: hypothetical protein KDA96_17280, partial [Planctomycetaceae bacterium]|nr:hypothetical protein [Planctomycetaceae bacterium]
MDSDQSAAVSNPRGWSIPPNSSTHLTGKGLQNNDLPDQPGCVGILLKRSPEASARGDAGQDFPVFGELLPSLTLRVSTSRVIQQA